MIRNTSANSDFKFLFDDNPQPMWIYNEQTLTILHVNEAAVMQYGYSRTEFLQKTLTDFYLPGEAPNSQKMAGRAPGIVSPYQEANHLIKSGAVIHVKVHSYAIDYNGVNACLMQISPDECKPLSNSLNDTRNRLDRVLHNAPVGYCQVNCSWTIINWNPAMQGLIEYREQDVIHKNFWQVLPELRHTDFYINSYKALKDGITSEFIEYFWPLQKWFSVQVYPAEGGLVLQLKDITNNKLFENALVDKLEQLKQVSFFNSHFIRKPVASLIGLTHLVQENLVDVNHFKEIANYISESSQELDEMLKRMNAMLNVNKNTLLQRNLNGFHFSTLLHQVANTYQSDHNEYEINLKLNSDCAYYGNEKAIQAIVKDLLDNAAHLSVEPAIVEIRGWIKGSHFIIAVRNYGKGLSPDELFDFFEAYNRNKITPHISPTFAKMFAIVKKHHGNFWVENIPNSGAEFFVSFPVSNIAAYKLNDDHQFSVYQEPQVDMTYEPALESLITNWTGFHTAGSVKSWSLEILNDIRQLKPRKVLIDNSELLGVWEGAVKWVNYEWTPKARAAGVTHIAIVYSSCTFSRISADHVKLHIRTDVVIQHFSAKAEALQWLNAQ